MKKEISSFVLVLSLMSLSNATMANWNDSSDDSSSIFSFWQNEDEEDNIQKKTSSRNYQNQRRLQNQNNMSMVNPQFNANTNANIVNTPNGYFVGNNQQQYQYQMNNVVAPNTNVYTSAENNLIQQSPLYFVPSENDTNSYNIDYDTLQAERTSNYNEVANSIDKWKNGGTNVFWENYRGNNIRIEMLRNNRDLKEMRLKFVQSQSMTSDPDGSISDILNVVADRVMKRTCGKKSKQSVILYERPSVELERETAADGYKVMAKGTSLKEYGFRCIY